VRRLVDLEQTSDKEALEVKMGEDACDEDLQRLGEFVGVISRHNREIKKFEDWLSEAVPLKFEKVSDMSSVKLKAGVMASVPLSFFSSGGEGMVSIGFLSVSIPSVGVGVEAVVEILSGPVRHVKLFKLSRIENSN
jgi:hypothetical protein